MVEQVDRDAAEAVYPAFLASLKGEDGGHGLAEAFARHRIAAEARGMEREFTDEEIIDAWGVLSASIDIHTVRLVAKALVRERRAALNGGQHE